MKDNNASQRGRWRQRLCCLPYIDREMVELDNSLVLEVDAVKSNVLEADDGKPRLELPSKIY